MKDCEAASGLLRISTCQTSEPKELEIDFCFFLTNLLNFLLDLCLQSRFTHTFLNNIYSDRVHTH